MSSETRNQAPSEPASNPSVAVGELAAVLADVHVALAVAASEQESLAAVMRYIARCQPQLVFLYGVHTDEQSRPKSIETAALWIDGKVQASHASYGQSFALAEHPMASLWVNNPHDLVEVTDAMSDPRLDPALRVEFTKRGVRGIVLLPLYSVSHGAWQGVLTINWREPHTLQAEERFVLSLITATLASFLANQRSDRMLRAALKEKQEQSGLLRTVLENLPVGVTMFEVPSGKPVLLNRHAAELLGRKLEQGPETDKYAPTFRALRPGSDEPMANEDLPLTRTMATGKACSGDVDIIGDDNQRRMIECTTVPIVDEAGRMTNAVLLFVDATQRKRAENERLRMQQELISVQAAALAERSTPLIPITDEIVVVPLIGSLDSERGAQLLDTLLTGVSQNRAKVAIIDITGVRTLDTQAAQTLTGAAQALRLLGVEPVLTGIRAEVAQTLVTLGVHLEGIATRSNLQSGIALAQRFVGQKASR